MAIRDRLTQLAELDARREAILTSLQERGLLTDELKDKIMQAPDAGRSWKISTCPTGPNAARGRRSPRKRAWSPWPQLILAQDPATDPAAEAAGVRQRGKGRGVRRGRPGRGQDIIAEWVNEDQTARARIRELFQKQGLFRTKVIAGKEVEGCKFEDYFEWEEPVAKAPSHRILAMRRGAREELPADAGDRARGRRRREPSKSCSSKGNRPARSWSARPPSTATSGSWPPRWKPRSAWRPRSGPTRRPSGSLPTTCGSCCWPRRWAARTSWPSIRAFARAARSCAWTARDN